MQPAPDLRERNLGAIFDAILDTDRDGIIAAGDFEQAEYARLFRLADVSDEVVLAGFGRLDQDGDGRISTQEFQAGAAHAFLSQDSANPGTAMLGLP